MKKIIVIVAVILLLSTAYVAYYGMPFGIIGNLDTSTNQKHWSNFIGTGELIGPMGREGYIESWKENGHSETISLIGKLKWKPADSYVPAVGFKAYFYKIYGFIEGGTGWKLLSSPEYSSTYLTGTNPGYMTPDPTSPSSTSGVWNANILSFDIIGSDLLGIRCEFWCQLDWNSLNPHDEGYEWVKMQSDEAYIYSGLGGLYLPRGLEEENPNLPYSTFEIGQVVRIGVETAKGGQSGDNTPWRVTLNRPYSGASNNMADPYEGTGVIEEQFFPDDSDASNTFFEFTVTKEMAELSMSTRLPFTVRIWNVLLPQGTLNIDFVDFYAKCPGKAICNGPTSAKVGNTITVSIDATVNSETQADIDFFRVSVVYGTSSSLLPSDWGSNRWIVHTTDIGGNNEQACSIPQSISYTATKEGYCTVFAKAWDVQGRPSKSTGYWTTNFWKPIDDGGGGEPPADSTDDTTGGGDYGGGHADPWLPWQPGDSDWYQGDEEEKEMSQILIYLIIGIILAIFATLALFFPIPGGIVGKLIVFIIGVIIAFIIYIYPF